MRKLLLSGVLALSLSCTLSAQCTTSSRDDVHVVQYGETLFKISKLYNISIDDLRSWNGMKFNEILSVCQELQIRSNTAVTTTTTTTPPSQEVFATRTVTPSTYPTTTTRSANAYQRQSGGRHIIQQGEQIASIAQLYGYTEERFRAFNALLPGQELPLGSILLSTDCSCERVSYSDQSRGLFQGNWNDQVIQQNDNAYYHQRYGNNIITSSSNTPSTGSFNNNYYTPPSQNNSPALNQPQGTRWGRVNTASVPSTPQNNNRTGNTTTTPTNSNFNPPAPIPSGRPATAYMSNEEQQMVNEINLVRSNPAGYITYVEQYIRDIKSGRAFGSSTTAAYELIDELKKTSPLSVLQPSECLYQAARQHGQEAVRIGSSGHQGQDGSWPWNRAKRACSNMQDGNENLVGGPSNIREAVMLLLVDDGITDRGHRKTLLNPSWKYVACYKSGQVGRMPNSWVQMFGY